MPHNVPFVPVVSSHLYLSKICCPSPVEGPQAPEKIATVQIIDDPETPPRAPRPEELPEELRAKVDNAVKAGPATAAKPKERKGQKGGAAG